MRRHWSSGIFFCGKCTIYDFPMAFEYQRVSLHFFASPLFILEGLFHPRVLTTGQLPPQRWREHMELKWLVLKYLWFFSVVIA